MTGRIKSFSPKHGTGVIETEDGNDVSFQIADVLAFDRIGLGAGKVVGFVEDAGLPNRAFDIFVCAGLTGTLAPKSSKTNSADPDRSSADHRGDDLRYTGFRFENGVRVYSFEERVIGEETRRYLVEAEVKTLLQHKVALQETPSLCLSVLHRKVRSGFFPEAKRIMRLPLAEADIVDFVSARTEAKPHSHARSGRLLRRHNPPA